MSVHDHGSGAAKRRRERRLRMHWRHEQLTLRMVLATVEHHSHGAPRGQTTATRTRAEERETYSAPRRQEPARSHHKHAVLHVGRRVRAGVGVAADQSGRAAGASGAASEAHHGAVWRTASHGAEDRRPLCSPAGDRSAQDLKPFLSSSSSGFPEPQVAEQVVEVPTVLPPLRIAEQIVGIPVPLGGGQRRVQGFPPRQGSTAPYSREERISERTVEQIVDSGRGEPHDELLNSVLQQSREDVHNQDVHRELDLHGHVRLQETPLKPVPGENLDDLHQKLLNSVPGQPGQSLENLREKTHLHELLPEDVVDEELQGTNGCSCTLVGEDPFCGALLATVQAV